jgi:hypothetical protein
LGFGFGRGPQSSTSSKRWPVSSPSGFTHVERPQKGESSHVWPGSTVAHRVEAKHTPGKSATEMLQYSHKAAKSKQSVSPKTLTNIFCKCVTLLGCGHECFKVKSFPVIASRVCPLHSLLLDYILWVLSTKISLGSFFQEFITGHNCGYWTIIKQISRGINLILFIPYIFFMYL